jgi:hypothetical protein
MHELSQLYQYLFAVFRNFHYILYKWCIKISSSGLIIEKLSVHYIQGNTVLQLFLDIVFFLEQKHLKKEII